MFVLGTAMMTAMMTMRTEMSYGLKVLSEYRYPRG